MAMDSVLGSSQSFVFPLPSMLKKYLGYEAGIDNVATNNFRWIERTDDPQCFLWTLAFIVNILTPKLCELHSRLLSPGLSHLVEHFLLHLAEKLERPAFQHVRMFTFDVGFTELHPDTHVDFGFIQRCLPTFAERDMLVLKACAGLVEPDPDVRAVDYVRRRLLALNASHLKIDFNDILAFVIPGPDEIDREELIRIELAIGRLVPAQSCSVKSLLMPVVPVVDDSNAF